MRRVKPVQFEYKYAGTPDSQERLRAAYSLVFYLARHEMLAKLEGKTRQAETPDKSYHPDATKVDNSNP